MITLTEKAKERIIQLIKDKQDASYFIRMGVKGGGCSGLSYSVELDNKTDPYDKVFSEPPAKVVCDQNSVVYLSGITVDFVDSLVGGGFNFKNPNATGSCGCGTSFSV